jgi:hypothetical protein
VFAGFEGNSNVNAFSIIHSTYQFRQQFPHRWQIGFCGFSNENIVHFSLSLGFWASFVIWTLTFELAQFLPFDLSF